MDDKYLPAETTILSGAILEGAVLDGADLRGVDLSGVHGLSQDQLASAITDEDTRFPAEWNDLAAR